MPELPPIRGHATTTVHDDELEALEAKLAQQEKRLERRMKGQAVDRQPAAPPAAPRPVAEPAPPRPRDSAPQYQRASVDVRASMPDPVSMSAGLYSPLQTMASPYDQKAADLDGTNYVPTIKAFENQGFMQSREARGLRIMAEFEETEHRLRQNNVHGTILFFGSARSMSEPDWKAEIDKAQRAVDTSLRGSPDRAKAEAKLSRLQKCGWMTQYCDLGEALARRVTEWLTGPAVQGLGLVRAANETFLASPVPGAAPVAPHPQNYVVCTGGGPGFMEAVNKGAASVPGARTMGMAISLPFEKGVNRYVTPQLAFEYHYFFTRKFWMMYQAKAIIACPGGFGTFDELFEALTLKQTGKLNPTAPFILIGKDFWSRMINFQGLADAGVIAQQDIDSLLITDDVDEAFAYLVKSLTPKRKARPLLVICGPSGVGKGTLIKRLMQSDPITFGFSVSHTTRDPRPGEVDGRDYHFVTKEQFKQMVRREEFVEHATVHGNSYGTTLAAVRRVQESGRSCILDIDVQGAQAIYQRNLDAYFVFVKPPSLDALEDRLRGRGTETEEKIQRRLANARGEMEFADQDRGRIFNTTIVNNDLDRAVTELQAAVYID